MNDIELIPAIPCVSITINEDFTVTQAEVHQWNFSHPSGFVVCDKCEKINAEIFTGENHVSI